MRQDNIWYVYVRSACRGILDCSPAYLYTQNQMLSCRITTLTFYILTNFKISNFNKEHTSSLKMYTCATFSGLQRRPENVAQLRVNIVKLGSALSEDLCRKDMTNARVGLQEVVRQNGGHIEHVLHKEQFSSL